MNTTTKKAVSTTNKANKGNKLENVAKPTTTGEKQLERTQYLNEHKQALKDVQSYVKEELKGLTPKDKKAIARVKKESKRLTTNVLKSAHNGLFNCVDTIASITGKRKPQTAFHLLSYLPITEVIKAGLNGRMYTISQVEKAFNLYHSDKDNHTLTNAKGERLNGFVNQLHHNISDESRKQVLVQMVQEKFIDLNKIPTSVVVVLHLLNVPTNERCIDMFETWQVTQNESRIKADTKNELYDLYLSGAVQIASEINND